MLMMGDHELLQEYAAKKSEAAFATLVERHINLVYSVALRYIGNPQHAEEITQAVFIILAKKASGLGRGTVLSGWLFKTARLTAANYLRAEIRRNRHEQEACMQSTLRESETDVWNQVAPLLDDAMADLGEKDRNALVLRFVEGKNLKEVGAAMGTGEEAAKKRVTRAVEKLRGFFAKRGVLLSSAALSGAIAVNAIQAAPVGLAASVTVGVAQGAALTSSTLMVVKGTLKLMAWTKLKIAVGMGVAALVAYQIHGTIAQKQQLAHLQEQLHQRDIELETARATVQQLKEAQFTMDKDLHSASVEKARLIGDKKSAVASAVAAAKASAKSGSNASPMDALAKMMDDPTMKDFMRQQTLDNIKRQYAPLLKKLNLTPEESGKFMKLLTENALKNLDVTSAMMRGDMDKTQIGQDRIKDQKDVDAQLQALLGEPRYAQYQDYTASLPARAQLDMFKTQFNDNPLSDDQNAKLLDVMKIETKKNGATQLGIDSSTQALEDYLQQTAESNQRIQQQAAGFLSPEQTEALGRFQTNMLNMAKVGMSMKQKFLDAKSN
jgi:RNA polymerase sigma factor (sigma-70 family)